MRRAQSPNPEGVISAGRDREKAAWCSSGREPAGEGQVPQQGLYLPPASPVSQLDLCPQVNVVSDHMRSLNLKGFAP